MINTIWGKKIPTALGMIIIIIGLSVTTLLANRQTFFNISAQENKQPTDVRITNIADNTFTISYKTLSPVSGYINYGSTNSLGQTMFDNKDALQKLQTHTIHNFTVQNLNPSTKYYFSIISGGDTYLNNNQNFEVLTSAINNSPTQDAEVEGKIILPDSSTPKEAIVYVTAPNSQVLSSQLQKDGSFKLNLSNLLTSDLSQTAELNRDTVMQLLALGDGLATNATFYFSQNNTLPVLTLSNNYDLRLKEQIVSTQSATLENFPIFSSTSTAKTKEPKIITPEKNQVFSNSNPVLKGSALPNKNVKIIIHSTQQIQANVTSDASGNWTYQPKTPLEPGAHTITVTTTDSNGILKTITQAFTVYAAESSITLTPTITILPTAPPADLNYENYASTSPTIEQSQLPQAGNGSLILISILGFIIACLGFIVFLLARMEI